MPKTKMATPSMRSVRFGEVVQLSKDRSQDPLGDGIERYVGLEHLEPEDLRVRRWGNVADGVTFTTIFKPGQVLFGKRRAYQRKVAVPDFAGVCSGDIYVLESKDATVLLAELVPFICQTDAFFEHAVGTSAGSLSPRTNWTSLADFQFVLPSIEQQRRIHRAMEAIEVMYESLRETETALRKLRASLSIVTFTANHGHALRPCSKLIANGDLSLQTGPFGTVLKASAYQKHGIPIVNPVNMRNGELEVNDGPFVGKEDWARLEKYWMRTGDMVMGRKGDMSNLIYVRPEYEKFVVGSDCIRFRVNPERIEPRYFFHFLRSELTQNWIQGQAYGTVMPGINEKILGRLMAYTPSLGEQAEIASKFDTIESSLQKINRRYREVRGLKSSMLRHVFNETADVQ